MRVPDRDDELADAQALRVAERGRNEVAGLRAEDGEVRQRVRSDDLEVELAAVGERCSACAGRARDDVRGREHEPVGRDHDRAAAAVEHPPAAHAARDTEAADGRRETFRDADHRARVRIESFGVVELSTGNGARLLRPEDRVDVDQRHSGQASSGQKGSVVC